jgi:D-glycero-D-manno-heptose 1,7-bisphosphate phosphatase
MPACKPSILLDRDNIIMIDYYYVYKIEDLAWVPGAITALKRFHDSGLDIFIVTNQGGVALGIFTERDMELFHQQLCA